MAKRLSLILRESDESDLAPFLQAGTAEAEALQRWAAGRDIGAVRSEASALRALLAAGAHALQEELLDTGYAQLAESYNTDVQHGERRLARARNLDRPEAAM